MTLTGSLKVVWIIALMTLLGAYLGETRKKPRKEPNVPFPPAYPILENLAAICTHGEGRPRYPDSFFPASSFSHLRRRGKAINRLESWYSLCCSEEVAQQPNQKLCCAQQAWKQALSHFCDEESSIMTLAYECCEYKEDAKWTCFNSELPNPDYSPISGYVAPVMSPEQGFTFDPNAC
ncbi:extracellular matrix protein 1-like [Odontesthes bonariensis]|uniref:extracellular matrix protein 1-like n=1 Tax=Odontesthes bonariensis TaxID=219752 RepID=UPI003F58D5B9